MLRATWATWTHGRRGAVLGASAAVVCLGGVLGACGSGGDDDGYVAVGAAGGPSRAPDAAAGPTGEVTLVPLDGTGERTSARANGTGHSPGPGDGSGDGAGADAEAGAGAGTDPDGGAAPGARPTSAGAVPSHGGTQPARPGTGASPSSPTPAPSRTTSGTPAALSVGTPTREAADERWCERVTLVFRNTGGTAVRSGTVTFGTHVIGALGVDWATVGSAVELPAPIGAGAREVRTWTVCVDAWRVPLGMHVETRDVSVRWT
ncbi:hypothetical protein ACFV0T_07235 [Streptomyces sp. NPDC059582]|uniref:hypothetical protein n=1 Tax=Streptomyces sp. NPDC059582 TaxID=3346875 RepID=UPI0036B4E27E